MIFFEMSTIVGRTMAKHTGAVEQDNRALHKRNRWSYRAKDEVLAKVNARATFSIFVDPTCSLTYRDVTR